MLAEPPVPSTSWPTDAVLDSTATAEAGASPSSSSSSSSSKRQKSHHHHQHHQQQQHQHHHQGWGGATKELAASASSLVVRQLLMTSPLTSEFGAATTAKTAITAAAATATSEKMTKKKKKNNKKIKKNQHNEKAAAEAARSDYLATWLDNCSMVAVNLATCSAVTAVDTLTQPATATSTSTPSWAAESAAPSSFTRSGRGEGGSGSSGLGPATSHALQVVRAFRSGHYASFFELYQRAPFMSAYLMDFLVAKSRKHAWAAALKAYAPSPLPVLFFHKTLAFGQNCDGHGDSDDGETEGEERADLGDCLEFIRSMDGVVVTADASSGDRANSISTNCRKQQQQQQRQQRLVVDTKESRARLIALQAR